MFVRFTMAAGADHQTDSDISICAMTPVCPSGVYNPMSGYCETKINHEVAGLG